jgi:hypothetical protein
MKANYTVKPHIAFLSCERDRQRELKDNLRNAGLKYQEVTGCYEGLIETSYLVVLSTEIHVAERKLDQVLKLARKYEQESILYCDSERTAYLLYCEGPQAPKLGVFQSVGPMPLTDNWTFVNGSYYEVK